MATGAVIARILTQYSDKGSKQAQKDIAKLGKKIDDYAKKASRAFGLVAFASAAAAVKIGKDSVMAASDISQQFGALDAVFQKNSKELKDFSKTMVEYGLSAADSARYSALLGTQLTGLGFTEIQAIAKTKELQILGADLAATFGGTTADAIAAFGSVLKGEYNPIERYGVAIRKSDITARVAAKGLGKLTGEALKQAEAQAAVELIFLKTTAAQGQAMREYNSLAAQLQRLDASYMNIKATVGLALLPVVERFTNYLLKEVIPAVEKWAETNKDQLAKSLDDVSSLFVLLIDNADNLQKVLQLLVSISTFLNSSILGLIKWGEALLGIFLIGKGIRLIDKIFGGIGKEVLKTGGRMDVAYKNTGKFGNALKKVGPNARIAAFGIGVFNTALAALRATAIGAAIATAFATAGVSVGTAALALAAVGITAVSVKALMGDYTKETTKATAATVDLSKQIYGGAAAEKYKAEVEAKNAKARAAAAAAEKKAAAAAAAQTKADAELKARVDAKILSLRKQLNITKDSALDKETDLIQLAAAEALLKKQGVIAKEEMAKLERIKNENFLLEARETLAKRYLDIQKVLADQKLDTKEIQELSKSWGISSAHVISYIHLVKSVEDQVISTEEIKTLADLWNTSEYEAHKFLETYMRIQDGLLDSNEVFALIDKGFFESEKDARAYADLVATVHDGIANDADFQRVADKWDLTKAQVNAYLAAMGADFDYEGTFIDPVTLLETQWQKAAKALQDYLDKLNSANTFDYNKLAPKSPVVPPVVVIPPKTQDPSGIGGSKTDSSAASAIAYAIAKAKGDMDAAAKAAAGVNPSALASQESGAIGAASIAAQLRAAEDALRISSSLAAFKAKEAADLAASQAASAQMDYDERFRFRNSMTMDNSKGLMGSGGNNPSGNTNVVVNVQGNVTTQQDLVQSIRNGLLAGQYNGQTLTLEAI
jgi:hypothetical protein